MTIAEKIRFNRRQQKLTQKEAGVLMGFPEPTAQFRISCWENGTQNPSRPSLIALVDAGLLSPEDIAEEQSEDADLPKPIETLLKVLEES